MYNKIVFLTRKNYFYIDYKLSDSFSNRIYLILFHLCFVLTSLKKKGADKQTMQEIFDFFIRYIDLNCRELGYGDTTINKQMKSLLKLFYEILSQTDAWKNIQTSRKNNLLLKFFGDKTNKDLLISKLTKYFDKFEAFLEDISLNSLIKGVFNFHTGDI